MPNNLHETKKKKKPMKNKINYSPNIAWIGKDTHTQLLMAPFTLSRWDKSSNE